MSDLQARREAIEAKRAARQGDLSAAREEQYVTDLEALDALECEHGDSSVMRLDVERYVKGQPTFVVLKTPSPAVYKRFGDMCARAAKTNDAPARRAAENMFGESCWVYPATKEAQASMLEHFPGLVLSIAIAAAKLVEARESETGKGD